jgi:hypothetical protein
MGSFYTNADGLQQQYGTRSVLSGAKEAAGVGVKKYLILDFNGVGLADTAPVLDLSAARLPAGAYVISATLLVETTFTGATATLDIGTFKASDGTELDMNGFVAAEAVAGLTAGADIAGAGAQIGTIIAQDAYVIATYNTAAFTAGKARCVIEYMMTMQ